MQTIYIVRHCKATGQEKDAPLTPEGKQQAEALKQFFLDKDIGKIITSPFTRAIDSIKPLSELKHIDLQLDSRLSERILSSENLPDWYELLKQTFIDMNIAYKGGESSKEALERGREVLDEIINQNDDQVILVSHGNLISLILHSIDPNFGFADWENMTNPDVFKIEVKDDNRKIINRVWA